MATSSIRSAIAPIEAALEQLDVRLDPAVELPAVEQRAVERLALDQRSEAERGPDQEEVLEGRPEPIGVRAYRAPLDQQVDLGTAALDHQPEEPRGAGRGLDKRPTEVGAD